MRKMFILCSAVMAFTSGCDVTPAAPAAPGVEFVTSTLPPTSAPVASATFPATNPAPTISPSPGTTTSEVNVRAEPSTAGTSLGTIPPFSPIEVLGRESFGYWFRIIFNDGTGWVRAEYVQVSAEIPVVDVDSVSGLELRGAVLRGVNVRSGPGTDFESLGLLNQYDIVFVFGTDASGAWIQIAHPPAPEGTGWVNSEYVEMENDDALPVIGETPVLEAAEPAPTQVTVSADGDSADSPLATFTLSPSSARVVRFQGEVSAQRDAEDWLAFSSSHAEIVIQLSCPAGVVQVELTPPTGAPIACASERALEIETGRMYLVKITPVSTGDPAYAGYEIRIEISN